MSRSILLIAGTFAVAAAILSACGGDSAPALGTPTVIVSATPPGGAKLTADEVIEMAREAALAVDDEGLQQTTVELEPTGLWRVNFKGMFYVEQPLPSPGAEEDTPPPLERACSVITVFVSDALGTVDAVTYSRADGCR